MPRIQRGFTDIQPHIMAGLFNIVLAFMIAHSPTTRITDYLQRVTGWPGELMAAVMALLLLFAGFYTLIFVPRGAPLLWGVLPIILYNGLTIWAVLREPNAPTGGALVSLFMVLYAFQNLEFYAEKQAGDALQAETAAKLHEYQERIKALESNPSHE